MFLNSTANLRRPFLRARVAKWCRLVLGAGLVACTSGCASTMALDRAVIAYDTTTADSVSKQLLLNIARARHNQPMHFTAISSIAATYRFSLTAGVGPALHGDNGALLLPVIGASAEENPTISIAPMQGEEFTATAADAVPGAEAHAAAAPGL